MERSLPEAGDVYWVELGETKGSEQAGRRPAVVLTERAYHEVSRRALVCPISSNLRPWAFNVVLPAAMKTHGAVLVDQIRTIDREARMFAFIEAVPEDILAQVRAIAAALVGSDGND